MPSTKVLKTLLEPFTPEIQSTLDLTIKRLPEDFSMVESAVGGHLTRAAQPLTGKGLKKEELKFADILDVNSKVKLTKGDLLERLHNRKDQFTQTTLKGGQTEFDDVTLKEFKSPNYEEKIRRYNNKGEVRNSRSHHSRMGINDELYYTRRDVIRGSDIDDKGVQNIDQKGRLIFEFQSDSHQSGKQYGYNLKESEQILDATRKDLNTVQAEEIKLINRLEAIESEYKSGAGEYGNLNRDELSVFHSVAVNDGLHNATPQDIKDEVTFITDRLDDLRGDRNVSSSKILTIESLAELKSSPGNIPFKDNDWLERAIDDELLDASGEGLKFIAVPLEVGSDNLARGGHSAYIDEDTGKLVKAEGVQKWYETQVRDTFKKKVNTLNKDIKKRNPDAGSDQLFEYKERTTNADTTPAKLIFSERTKNEDIDLFIDNVTDEDLNFLLTTTNKESNVIFKNIAFSISSMAKELVVDGTFTNIEHATKHATRNQVGKAFDNAQVNDINKMLKETFGHQIKAKASHTLGVITLPKDSAPVDQAARAGTQFFPTLDPQSLADYVGKSSMGELKAIIEASPELTAKLPSYFWQASTRAEIAGRTKIRVGESANEFFKNAKLNDAAIASRKNHFIDMINNLPPNEIERLSRITGIKRLNTPPTSSKVLPAWSDSLRTFSVVPIAGAPKVTETLTNLQSQSDTPIDQEAVIGNLQLKQDKRFKAEIGEALKKKTAIQVEDFLVNRAGKDRGTVHNIIEGIMKDRVVSALQQGKTPNEVFKVLLQQGYKAEEIDKYMPSENALDTFFDVSTDILLMIADMSETAAAVLLTGTTSFEDNDAETTAALALSANEVVESLWVNLNAPFSRPMAIKAKTMVDAINVETIRAFQAKGIEAQLGENGAILVKDSNGQFAPLDVNMLDIMAARKDEVLFSIAGAMTGVKLAPPVWYAKVVGGVAGSMVGAGIGRGLDIIRSRMYNKQELEGKFIMDEMINTGAADGILNLIGMGVLKTGGATWKLAKWAQDKVTAGNLDGAHRALMDYLHMTPELADEQVEAWSKLNLKEAADLSTNQKERHFQVLSRTHPLAFRVAKPAMGFNSRASINMSREINKRQRNLIDTVSKSTNDRAGAVVRDELPEYNKRVQNNYDSTKELAVLQMKDSGYTFNYDKLVTDKTLRDAVDGIDNPTIRAQANSLFTRIQKIGERTIKGKGETPTTTNSRRSFSELIELRELVVKFGDKKNITGVKDKEMATKMLSGIDREISKAVRGNIEGAKPWLQAWKLAKQGMENKTRVNGNVLYKAILKTGSSDADVMRSLAKRAQALDGTYREVMQALPEKLRGPIESGVIRELITNFTIGEKGALQAIDFVGLSNKLKDIPMSSELNKKYKQGIAEMARVYKNDPHLLAASGTVNLKAFASFLTDDALIRIKYATITKFFNYVQRLLPGEEGRKVAMIVKLGEAMEKPGDSIKVNALLTELPPNPELRNELRRNLGEIADWNAKSNFPKVEVYSRTSPGHSLTPTKGPLGTGRYVYTTTKKASSAYGKAGGKANTDLVLPDRIADDIEIRNVLGIPADVEITPKFVKEYPDLKQKLEARGKNGIIINDQIMLF